MAAASSFKSKSTALTRAEQVSGAGERART